ncbi:MAG: hypothetical protein ABI907_09930 [Ramlibacter sp.]
MNNVSYLQQGTVQWGYHQQIISAMGLGGLCCSWAMDYVKKCLAGKALTLQTYADKGRIQKIADRHKLQGTAQPGTALHAVAGAYKLQMSRTPDYHFKNSHISNGTSSGAMQAGNYYYVQLIAKPFKAHGFAFFCQTATSGDLADSYNGIFNVTNVTNTPGNSCGEILEDWANKFFGDDLVSIDAFRMWL